MEKVDRQELISLIGHGGRWTRGHSRKSRKVNVWETLKVQFSHRTVHIQNSVDEEIVMGESVHKFQEKLDEIRYGDRSLWALLEPCNIQLGKYTRTPTHLELAPLSWSCITAMLSVTDKMVRFLIDIEDHIALKKSLGKITKVTIGATKLRETVPHTC